MANTKVELVQEVEALISEREKIGMTDNSKLQLIVRRAKEGYYHDFETPIATPKVQLVADLRETGLKKAEEIAQRVINGDFDE